MASVLIATLLTSIAIFTIVNGYSSCLANCGIHHSQSLYEQYCCCLKNKGKSFRFKQIGFVKYVLCPKSVPKTCLVCCDCKSWLNAGKTVNGVYTINPDGQTPFDVYCDMKTDGGGWIVFQRRMDGSVDFFRNWTQYEKGFGNLNGEFWLGLTKLHRLTKDGGNRLRVDLENFQTIKRYAHYTEFVVGTPASEYTTFLTGFSGNAGDSMTSSAPAGNINGKFSTIDNDNDGCVTSNCAASYHGGWWYRCCHYSNLNGVYNATRYARGVNWATWTGYDQSLKFTEMKIKLKD